MQKNKYSSRIFVLLLSLPALIFALPLVLNILLKRELLKAGLLDPRFQLSFHSLDSASLAPLSFRYPLAQGQVEVELKGLMASYSVPSLQERRLTRLELRDGNVLFKTPSSESPKSDTTTTFAKLRMLLDSLPIDDLTLQNVMLQLSSDSSLLVGEGSLLSRKEVRLKSELKTTGIQLRSDLSITLSTGDFQAKGEIQFPGVFVFPFSLQGTISGESIESKVQIPLKNLERPIAGSLRYAISTEQGEFELSTTASDGEPPESLGELQAKNIQLRLQGKIVRNNPAGLSLSLKVETLQSYGILVKNLLISAQPRPDNFYHLSAKLHAELFGGTVDVEKSEIDLKTKQMEFPVRVVSIDLQELLKLYPQQGLSAEGKLGGNFVVKRNEKEEVRAEGEVQAESPGGVIRYKRQENDGAPSTLDFATQALEDFRFSKLEAPFTLDPQGELSIHLSLGGNNPIWQNGRAVEFNINLDQNLYSLIRSIRLSRGDLSAIR